MRPSRAGGILEVTFVILAAGQGTRMRSALPKVLQPLAGRPLLAHVIDTAQAAGGRDICVVYGHGGEAVRPALAEARESWAHQAEQLGHGNPERQALPATPRHHRGLVRV